ncbi:glycosyl transferase [Flavobacterium noncentrifugens]|uniref:Glycosyltransferase sugar-binding region containing DXD motif-containing protein n=1 Tax=Flavobacterium noncentrifugens TaxID=1128970 RepID=A0A1G8V7X3_9FLAO|nr:glycosyltransferase [Flavobacterium noncentrifugens]GEP50377.1 glycosyl transferase [Flavobacterium noncentrifugens]SDJ62069.1 Glycosyltransferase sugar-binding region containing DXD motif-containing protein [Flavobacterium noncentrifugens]
MIPKIIHYCWFGGNPLPPLAEKCIASWKKFLPDYEIMEWNEGNFPIDRFIFAKQALESRKFAFVSDVSRLYALKEFGGIYMDTDVEVLKSLDDFLHLPAFSGFENDDFVPTGIMASEKGGEWVRELLEYYDNRPFINADGSLEMESNTIIITKMMLEKGFVMSNTFQEKEGYVAFYPNDYFCPKSYKTGNIELTENSYCIHHFAQSWVPMQKKWKNVLKLKVMGILGYKNVQKLIDVVKK